MGIGRFFAGFRKEQPEPESSSLEPSIESEESEDWEQYLNQQIQIEDESLKAEAKRANAEYAAWKSKQAKKPHSPLLEMRKRHDEELKWYDNRRQKRKEEQEKNRGLGRFLPFAVGAHAANAASS